MLGAGLPQVSAGWVLMSWADAVPVPGSPRASRLCHCTCGELRVPGSLLHCWQINQLILQKRENLELFRVTNLTNPCSSCLHCWQINQLILQKREPETVQDEKPHQPSYLTGTALRFHV